MPRLRKKELPAPLTQRREGESDAEYAIRRAAAYIMRDNQRNINDYASEPEMVASLRRYLGRSGYPPA